MPISAIDGLSSEHWKDVLSIITDAVSMSDFDANLVSNGSDVGVIQKRIIQNLYKNPIVVCDVSAKNPNVMFELGLRLAFDKPTIIIKDDKTNYSFDTSPIEHLEYPRDLRFNEIVKFKKELSQKIIATHTASQENPNYTTFLKHFGEYKITNIEETEISSDKYILESIESLRKEMIMMRRHNSNNSININEFLEKDELREIVYKTKLKEYLSLKDLANDYEITSKDLEDDFVEFLASFSEIRSLIRTKNELRDFVDKKLELPF
ncbi:ATP-dependent RNA helicase [Nonlabens dokdonensis DSW-6]|uniref:ATP-dependent RNA helicase n=2 Tax=Nonlabens dokdonensis TaxID=328515 RepID=L7WDH4_NONDD|nr:ATP-dependent RNA helicase [Nonlabens dokdonensis DSW-6]